MTAVVNGSANFANIASSSKLSDQNKQLFWEGPYVSLDNVC